MSKPLSLKQAHKKIGGATGLFAKSIIRSLEEWVKAADDLRGHAQYPCTEATRQLVQAALQQQPRNQELQKPRSAQQYDQFYRPWVAKHLPGVCAAMQECVTSQLNITVKRISIVHSLAKHSPQHDMSHLQLRIVAESRASLLVEIQWWVLCVILPIAAVCKFVARSGKSSDLSERLSGLRLHDDAAVMLAQDLAVARNTRGRLQDQVSQAHKHLSELGVLKSQSPPRHIASYHYILRVVTHVDMLWLHMAAQVLPHYKWAVFFVRVMFGPGLELSPEHKFVGYDFARADLFRLLVFPGLFLQLKRTCTRGFIGKVLLVVGMTAERLQSAGMPAAIQEELLSMMKDAAASDSLCEAGACEGQLLGNQGATGGHSATHRNQQGVDGSMGSSSTDDAGAAVDAAGAQDEGDFEEGSMQALVEMMYGSMI